MVMMDFFGCRGASYRLLRIHDRWSRLRRRLLQQRGWKDRQNTMCRLNLTEKENSYIILEYGRKKSPYTGRFKLPSATRHTSKTWINFRAPTLIWLSSSTEPGGTGIINKRWWRMWGSHFNPSENIASKIITWWSTKRARKFEICNGVQRTYLTDEEQLPTKTAGNSMGLHRNWGVLPFDVSKAHPRADISEILSNILQ